LNSGSGASSTPPGGASSSSSCQASALRGSSAGRKGSSSIVRDGRSGGSKESAAIFRFGGRGWSPVIGRYGSYGAIGRAAGGRGELPDARSCSVSSPSGSSSRGPEPRPCWDIAPIPAWRAGRACLQLTSSPRFQDSMVGCAARTSATRTARQLWRSRPVLPPASLGAGVVSVQATAAPRRGVRSRARMGLASVAASRSQSAWHAAPRARALRPPVADD
jgi:hypothetical protein